MGGDISRSTFNPSKGYSGVRQQQGRVNLDADWNEQVDIATHRLDAGTRDFVGPSGAPRDTAGFSLAELPAPPSPNPDLTISAGRLYVAGRLCELASSLVAIENFTGDGTGPAGNQVQLASVVLDGAALEIGQWVQISAQGTPTPAPQLAQVTAVNAAAGSVTFSASVSSFGTPNTSPQLQRIATYLTQADYPAPPALPTSGSAIVYLDVWERTINALDDPTIQEIALGGPDTATRTKNVWQLKFVPVPNGVSCSTPDSEISAWETAIQASGGLLTNGVVPSTSAGPCSIATGSGFTGIENQYYRVEIQQPGTLSAAAGPVSYPVTSETATFKWSRDNGSVATGVTAIAVTASSAGISTSQLTVQSTGRDAVLSFSPQDWVEITDDFLELSGLAGELHQIDSNGVDQTRATITLTAPVSAALQGRITGSTNYHTRIIRWDQGGQVFEAGTGTLWADLNSAGSTGDIPLPPPGTSLVLEGGITVSFGLNASSAGLFNIADSWSFAARTADGSIESLVQAPPFGIRHQYCRLGTISFDASPWAITDCRQLFPPLADPGVHVTSVSLTGATQALLNDSSITVQQLAAGISVSCDGALDPSTVNQPNNIPGAGTPQISTAQATCFVSVGLPVVSGTAVVGYQPLALGATVLLDTSQTTIQWLPTGDAINGLTALMTALAKEISPNNATPTLPTLLAQLTLKGSSIWALDNPDVYLDGETLGTPYLDAGGTQHTGLLFPSGDGRRGGDFAIWFWLTSQPSLTISTTELDFLPTPIGTSSASQTVTLTNTTANVIPLTISIGGGFTQTNTCTVDPAGNPTIPANSSCTFTVTFSPIVTISFSEALTITGGGVTLTVVLTGTGVDAQLGVSPTSIAFGGQYVNTTGAVQPVTLTNTGSLPIVISGVSTASNNFLYPTTCSSLPVGGACSINVQFSPKVLGQIHDSITITSSTPGLQIPTVSLSGTGTQPKNETKDVDDAKTIRDNKIIKDKPKGYREQIVAKNPTIPVVFQKEALTEAATAKPFIQAEERPAVGQQALKKPEEPTK